MIAGQPLTCIRGYTSKTKTRTKEPGKERCAMLRNLVIGGILCLIALGVGWVVASFILSVASLSHQLIAAVCLAILALCFTRWGLRELASLAPGEGDGNDIR